MFAEFELKDSYHLECSGCAKSVQLRMGKRSKTNYRFKTDLGIYAAERLFLLIWQNSKEAAQNRDKVVDDAWPLHAKNFF